METEAKTRIEIDADVWLSKLPWMESYKIPLLKEAYVAGATAELASLREQLKQKEEVIRELTAYLSELVDDHRNGCFFIDFEERTGAIIEKAKKLLEPQ